MGTLVNLIDAILSIYFLIFVIAPLTDAQTCLPPHLFPDFLVDYKNWYIQKYDDYLVAEKPLFFVGKRGLSFFCCGHSHSRVYQLLIHGVSTFTIMVTIMPELQWSGRVSNKMLKMYSPFPGLAILAILRGLVPSSGNSTESGKRGASKAKKRA